MGRLNWPNIWNHFSNANPKAAITTAADDIHKLYFIFSEKIRLDIPSESSARQRIHMKNQTLFSTKDKSKKLKKSSAAIFVQRFKS